MEEKIKNELLKTYFKITKERYDISPKLFKCAEDFQLILEKKFEKHINNKPSEVEQVKSCLRLLPTDRKVVYLGVMLSLKENNYSYLDKALNTYIKLMMLQVHPSGADHCMFSRKLVPIIFTLKNFETVEKIFPKECGLSTRNTIWGGIVTNLIMYLYYQEYDWKEHVINNAEKYLNKNDTLENQSIVKALLALVNKDFKQFSLELCNICKGRKKSREFDENEFTIQFSFYSLGLYNFAIYLYPDSVNKITLPDDESFLTDYLLYQKNGNYFVNSYIIEFTETLSLLKKAFKVEIPSIVLIKDGKDYVIDCESFNNELVKRIIEVE
ncbi:MAG: hypothetical protein HFG33_03425 [Bacilli bacterium]|nr:hypothetical protein [Bacilli bacterium]